MISNFNLSKIYPGILKFRKKNIKQLIKQEMDEKGIFRLHYHKHGQYCSFAVNVKTNEAQVNLFHNDVY